MVRDLSLSVVLPASHFLKGARQKNSNASKSFQRLQIGAILSGPAAKIESPAFPDPLPSLRLSQIFTRKFYRPRARRLFPSPYPVLLSHRSSTDQTSVADRYYRLRAHSGKVYGLVKGFIDLAYKDTKN